MVFGLSKENIAKLAVVAVVALFVVQVISLYSMQGNGLGGRQPQRQQGGNGQFDSFDGTGTANASIISWETVLFVSGKSPEIAKELDKLKQEGIVKSAIGTNGTTVVMLKSGSMATKAAVRLLRAKADVFADGFVSLDGIQMQGPDFVRNVSTAYLTNRMVPIFEPGDTFSVAFQGSVKGGQLASVGQISLAPQPPIVTTAVPENVTVSESFLRAEVPWEQRNLVNVTAVQEKLGGSFNATYRLRNTVVVNSSFNSQGGSAFLSSLPPYVLSVQQNMLLVGRNTVDKPSVILDLGNYGLLGDFPPSLLEIRVKKNASLPAASQLASALATEGVNAPVKQYYSLSIVLPDVIETDSGNYTLIDNEMVVNSLELPGSNPIATFRLYPSGKFALYAEPLSIANQGKLEDLIKAMMNQTNGTNSTNGASQNPQGNLPVHLPPNATSLANGTQAIAALPANATTANSSKALPAATSANGSAASTPKPPPANSS